MFARTLIRPVLATAVLGALLSALVPAHASADVTIDDSYLNANLNNNVRSQGGNRPAEVNYYPMIRVRFFGDVADGDAARFRFTQGRRALGEVRCSLTVSHGNARLELSDRCWTQSGLTLTAHGAIDVAISYIDDSTDQETPVRTLKLDVGRFWAVDRTSNPTVHSVRYQVVGDDLLGLSYAWFSEPDDTEPHGDLYFYTWATLVNGDTNFRDPSWRCTLNGERVSEMDVRGTQVIESISDIRVQNDQMQGRERTSEWYQWRLMWIKPQLIWGERNPRVSSGSSSTRYNVSEHPGAYVCQLRENGDPVREFRFTIGDDGRVVQHPAQVAGELSLRPGAYFVETRFFGEGHHEASFNRDAVRRSLVFGRPWPTNPAVRAYLDALPRSYGRSQPRPPRR